MRQTWNWNRSNSCQYLLEIVSRCLDELFELLFVVIFARSRFILLLYHYFLSKGRTRLAEEFTLATLDIIFPFWLLEVLRSWWEVHQLRLQVSEILPLLPVGRVTDPDVVLGILFGRSVELVTKWIFVYRSSKLSDSKASFLERPVYRDGSLIKIGACSWHDSHSVAESGARRFG